MSKKYRFRSGSEKTMAEFLTASDIPFDFEPHYIPYVWIESKRYLPDFILESSGIILEVKGRFKLEVNCIRVLSQPMETGVKRITSCTVI